MDRRKSGIEPLRLHHIEQTQSYFLSVRRLSKKLSFSPINLENIDHYFLDQQINEKHSDKEEEEEIEEKKKKKIDVSSKPKQVCTTTDCV